MTATTRSRTGTAAPRAPRRAATARTVVAAGAAALVATTLAACGGAHSPAPLHAAPEPASAPPVTTAPAGRLIVLPGGPSGHAEGITVAAASATVAVALRTPPRLVLIDADTLTVGKVVAVPGAARHLELAGPAGPVLVPGETSDTLAFVAVPSGRLLANLPTGHQPHDVAVVDGTEVVANEFGRSVTVITHRRVVATLPSGLQPGGATGVGDIAVVVDVRGRLLYLYRVQDGTARADGTLDAGVGPTHAVGVGDGRVVVADTSGGALLLDQVTGAHPRQLSSTPRPGRPYGLAFDPRTHLLWVTATGENLLLGYRVGATTLTQVASYPTPRDAYSVAVDHLTGRVFVAGQYASVVQVIDP